MRKDLKDIIQRFNDIQYPNNEGKRIVIATLKPKAKHNATIANNN